MRGQPKHSISTKQKYVIISVQRVPSSQLPPTFFSIERVYHKTTCLEIGSEKNLQKYL